MTHCIFYSLIIVYMRLVMFIKRICYVIECSFCFQWYKKYKNRPRNAIYAHNLSRPIVQAISAEQSTIILTDKEKKIDLHSECFLLLLAPSFAIATSRLTIIVAISLLSMCQSITDTSGCPKSYPSIPSSI